MDLDSFKYQYNSRPIDDFLGLSSTEMHHILYNPLSENSPVRLRRHLPDEVLDVIPALRIFESLVELILAAEREGFEPNSPICSISVIYENSFR